MPTLSVIYHAVPLCSLRLWSFLLALVSEPPLFCAQCHSESSRSEDISSDGEEDDDSPSLSPSSSHSCSKTGHNAPPSDSPAPCNLQIEGANFLSATPAQWSVEEVYRFISSLQGWCSLIRFGSLDHVSCSVFVQIFSIFCSGCEELATQFLSQEIDGQALLLLREDHLISTMNIKLGPALKICASINTLREWCSLQGDRRISLSLISPLRNQYLDLLLF